MCLQNMRRGPPPLLHVPSPRVLKFLPLLLIIFMLHVLLSRRGLGIWRGCGLKFWLGLRLWLVLLLHEDAVPLLPVLFRVWMDDGQPEASIVMSG